MWGGGQVLAEIIEAKPIPLKLRFSEKVTKSFDITFLVTSKQRERFYQIVRHSELIEFKIFVINCPDIFSDLPTALLLLLLEDGRKNPKESRKF